MKLKFLSFVVILLVVAASGFALSVSPGKFDVEYVPLGELSFSVQVEGAGNLVITPDLGTLENFRVISQDTNRGTSTVNFAFTMPSELEPGEYRSVVLFKEDIEKKYGQKSGSVGAVPQVGVAIDFNIPYPGKYLKLKKFERDYELQEGGTLFVKLIVQSLGTQSIDKITGNIGIDVSGVTQTMPLTSITNLGSGAFGEMFGEWTPPTGTPFSIYTLSPTIVYDGVNLSKVFSPQFVYGGKEVQILSLSPLSLPQNEITPVNVKLKSLWGDVLPVAVTITPPSSTGRDSVTSATIDLPKYSEGVASLFLDTHGWGVGKNSVDVTADYGGKSSSVSFDLDITASAGEIPLEAPVVQKPESNLTLIIIIVLLVIIVVGLVVWKLKSAGAKDENEEF